MGDQGGWLWFMIDVIGVLILAIAIIYGITMWRRRSRDPAVERARDRATEDVYREP